MFVNNNYFYFIYEHHAGPPTPQRICSRLNAAIPLQTEGAGASRAADAGGAHVSRGAA